MINNAKLCGLVVMLCVIAPVCVGYAWPVDAGENTIYEVGYQSNITKDIANGDVNVYTEFIDPFVNNWNVFEDNIDGVYTSGIYDQVNAPDTTTGNYSSIPAYAGFLDPVQVTSDSSGYYSINDINQWLDDNYPVSVATGALPSEYTGAVLFSVGSWDNLYVGNFIDARAVIYYPSSNTLFYITSDEKMYLNEWNTSVIFYGDVSTSYDVNCTLFVLQEKIIQSYPPLFVDTKFGFNVPTRGNGTPYWYNGYTNASADILFKLNRGNEVSMYIGDSNEKIRINVDAWGDITVYSLGDSQFLGSVDNFPYILVTPNAYQNKVEVVGLIGLSDFIDDYNLHKRLTITIDQDIDPFTYMTIYDSGSYDEGKPKYYIPRTFSNISTTQGINNGSVDLKLYANDGDGQIRFGSLTVWPEGSQVIEVRANGSNFYGSITEDGTLTFNGTETFTGSIKNLIISSIGDTVYFNGKATIVRSSYIYDCVISLNGEWLGQIYYADLTGSTSPTYSWIPGGFGLDVGGFCMCGLMTSGGSGLACMLYGRRSGGKALLVGITATICAAVYLVLLMTS